MVLSKYVIVLWSGTLLAIVPSAVPKASANRGYFLCLAVPKASANRGYSLCLDVDINGHKLKLSDI